MGSTMNNKNIDEYLPKFIAKKHFIIFKKIEGESLFLDYVEELNEDDIDTIKLLLNKDIIYDSKLTKNQFKLKYKELYDEDLDVDPVNVEKIKEPEVINETEKYINIQDIPLEKLEKELHRRYINIPAKAVIEYKNGKFNFEIDNLKWPEGKYDVTISVNNVIEGSIND